MKNNILILLSTAILLSCGSNKTDKTVTDAKGLEKEIKAMQPGGIPTTQGGWTMTAKINGKEWSANSIISPDAAGRIAGDNGTIAISLPYDRRYILVGEKTTFSNNNAVDLILPSDDGGILGGYSGEMEITKVNNEWAEGIFHFTASDTGTIKEKEVTDGFFRISMAKPQK